MPSLLIVVFIFQLTVELISSIGASTITELLWLLYTKFPTSTAEAAKSSDKLRNEVLRLKREMAGVSAQDDFARWAKLKRQLDKASENYDKSSSKVQSHKTTFTSTASTVRFLLVHILRFILQWWYSSTPMFWIPARWVPGYVEWILCFPRAPIGSVSIQVWGVACGKVVKLASDAVRGIWGLVEANGAGKRQEGRQGEKMAFATSESGGPGDMKKEL